jgi:glycosyltransferase involved in cell wall biosynthesis
MKKNITFVIFTYNEEKRIGYIIKNFINYGDVFLMDGGSTDNTKKIAEELGAKYVLRPKSEKDFAEHTENYNFILKNINTEWIYWGFADNHAPKSLLNKVSQVIKEGKIKYIMVPLYTYLYGKTKYPMLKSYNPMFFHKNYIDFTENTIHGMGKYLGRGDEKLILPNHDKYAVRHYSLYDLNKFIHNHLRYAEIEAKMKYENGKKFNIFIMLGAMARYFILYYKFSYKAGIKGLLMAIMYSFFRFMVYARLYEIENNLNLEIIEKKFIKSKEEILKEF